MASQDAVRLDGSGSSAGDPLQPLTYSRVQLSGLQAQLSGADTARLDFAASAIAPLSTQELVFELTVNDGRDSATDTFVVTVAGRSNTAPTADVGADVEITTNTLWTLNGSGSTDPDADIFLNAATGAVPRADWRGHCPSHLQAPPLNFGDAPLVLVFGLPVSDGIESSDEATVEIVVRPPENTPHRKRGDGPYLIAGGQ